MRQSSVAHLHAGHTGLKPVHTVLFPPLSLLGDGKVPEGFYA